MKFLNAALAIVSLATTANAGTLVFDAEEEDEIVIVEDEPMGSSKADNIEPPQVGEVVAPRTEQPMKIRRR